MKAIHLERQIPSPCVTPQALAWDGQQLWLSSRDLGTLYRLEQNGLQIGAEFDPSGVIWAGVLTEAGWRFTIGKGLNDDRYVYSFSADEGFRKLFACPEFTGSYLSSTAGELYLSQWYKGEIHRLDDSGAIARTIQIGAEICGHTFVDGLLYVLRGRENQDVPGQGEEWNIARLDLRKETPQVEDIATVPFASRSLAHDGECFWSNHRAANEIVAFTLPR